MVKIGDTVQHVRSGMIDTILYVSNAGLLTKGGLSGSFKEFLVIQQELFDQPKEADPNGVPQHAPGAKLDAGKLLAGQILGQFPRALAGVAEVGTFGARKYTLGGWQEVANGIARYADAKVRHWLARMRGEEFDSDSKIEHLKHEAWNVLAELELTLREKEKQ